MLLHKKKLPVNGDLRIRKIFALFPKDIDKYTSAWLQYVWRVEVYENYNKSWRHSPSGYFLDEKTAKEHLKKHTKQELPPPHPVRGRLTLS
jgi:hypothetical protein